MIKERLKELRQEAGLTQVQMAEILGIEGRTYQRLEITEAAVCRSRFLPEPYPRLLLFWKVRYVQRFLLPFLHPVCALPVNTMSIPFVIGTNICAI